MDEQLTPEQMEVLGQIYSARKRVTRMVFIGAAWWAAAAIAIAVALSSTGGSIYWFGGLLVGATYWWRAFQLHRATVDAGLKPFIENEKQIFAGALILAVASALILIPEYMRIESPAVGTCWAETSTDSYVPVACWSSNATLKTISLVENESSCYTGMLFEARTDGLYTCLEER